MRILHWTRAVLIIGLIALGWGMTSLPNRIIGRFGDLYPIHKEFGILAFCIGLTALLVRTRSKVPAHATGLRPWETMLSIIVHHAMLALAVIVPVMGYCLSSAYPHGDGVPFFGLHLPLLLARDQRTFEIFDWLHARLAYLLLGLVVLHVAGVVKHRLLDRNRSTDVLPRML